MDLFDYVPNRLRLPMVVANNLTGLWNRKPTLFSPCAPNFRAGARSNPPARGRGTPRDPFSPPNRPVGRERVGRCLDEKSRCKWTAELAILGFGSFLARFGSISRRVLHQRPVGAPLWAARSPKEDWHPFRTKSS